MGVFTLILNSTGSRPKAYRNMENEHLGLTDLSFLKLGVRFHLLKFYFDSNPVKIILNQLINSGVGFNFLVQS